MSQQTTNFVDVISSGLQRFCQMQNSAADALAKAIACAAAESGYAGAEYYLPALHTLTRVDRNDAIRREFNGQNLRAICRKYCIHKATVYRIVKRGE
jgi:Mor family transcriptional regulator